MESQRDEDNPARARQRALVEFFHAHYDEWLNHLRRHNLPQTDAELLLEKALERLARDSKFDPSQSGANQYVYNKLNYRMRDFWRSRRSRTSSGTYRTNDPTTQKTNKPRSSPLFTAASTQARRAIWEAVCRLPDNYRFVIVCRYWLAMDRAKIASLCNAQAPFAVNKEVTEGTVTSWLYRGRESLRKHLAPDLFPSEDS